MRNRYVKRPVGRRELQSLAALAKSEEDRFFKDNSHLVRPYGGRLIAVALCQGAALHYLGRGRGVKDFDVHFFYSQNPRKPRLSRTVKRIFATVGSFKNFPVDFVRTVVPSHSIPNGGTTVQKLQSFLHRKPTDNASHLAQKAVIGLMPRRLFGKVVWMNSAVDPTTNAKARNPT